MCWSTVVKEKPIVDSPFLGRFLLTIPLRQQRMSMNISLFTVLKKFPQSVIPLNWTSKFQELFTATTYVEI